MTPAPCWFPMTMIAMNLMMQQSVSKSKPRKKIAKEVVKRPAQNLVEQAVDTATPDQTSTSSLEPTSHPPRLELKDPEDPVEQTFWEACHRSLQSFQTFASMPRTGMTKLMCIKYYVVLILMLPSVRSTVDDMMESICFQIQKLVVLCAC